MSKDPGANGFIWWTGRVLVIKGKSWDPGENINTPAPICKCPPLSGHRKRENKQGGPVPLPHLPGRPCVTII